MEYGTIIVWVYTDGRWSCWVEEEGDIYRWFAVPPHGECGRAEGIEGDELDAISACQRHIESQ